jgi:hypothetical protein
VGKSIPISLQIEVAVIFLDSSSLNDTSELAIIKPPYIYLTHIVTHYVIICKHLLSKSFIKAKIHSFKITENKFLNLAKKQPKIRAKFRVKS